ncbi:DNA and RNA helicase [Paenibacillus sp. GCM10028914]|uniref:DNA and RNA helicase n=1 Tax=Paenibacillus sp. GCM10028914 TaxID=3273416 RepID=UPI00361E06C5
MLHNHYPVFTKGRILKLEMLENLRDYPRWMLDILHTDLSDGIVAGMDITVRENTLMISKGVIKQAGKVYVIEEEQQISYASHGTEQVLRIRCLPEQHGKDFMAYPVEIVLDGRSADPSSELELARFKLKPGASLRSSYESFADFATEFNTLNRIYAAYASLDKSTFYPDALRYFARMVMDAGGGQANDYAFAMQVLSSERPTCRDAVLYYIGIRLGTGYRTLDNGQIHKYLNRILEEIRSGSRGRNDYRGSGIQRMLVD